MDVVYVIGTGSKFGNEELRYSLRSICRFAQNLGEVYIVGDVLPPFINPESVHYIHYEDRGLTPAANVYFKLCELFEKTDLQQFLLSSDDHFFIRPVDFDQWPVLYKGHRMPGESDLRTGAFGDVQYTRCMIDSAWYMSKAGLKIRYYEGHTNKLYTREAWDYMHQVVYSRMMGWDKPRTMVWPCTNSLMGASIMHLHPDYPCQYRKDIKLHHLDRMSDWVQLLDAHSFSIYDSAWNTGVFDFLSYLFPEKCRFEV